MGNDVSVNQQQPTFSEQDNSNQPSLIEQTNFQSISPMHRYTNYQTILPIKTISSIKTKAQTPTPIPQPLALDGCQLRKQLNKVQPRHSNAMIKLEDAIIKLEVTKQQPKIQKQNLGLLIHTQTFKSNTLLAQQSSTEFKSLVINYENFVNLKEESVGHYYDFKEILGEGAYGQVFRAICKKTGQNRAIKKIKIRNMKKDKRKQLLSELNLLSKLTHPSIILVYDVFLNDNKYYVVMEYCKGGAVVDMLSKCKNKSERTISYIIKQLLSALSYMHSQNIVHRDIKLDNIVFLHPVASQSSEDECIPIKIIDFGSAVEYQGKEVSNYPMAGTLSYMAPEVLKGILTTKSDIWSVGVLLIILLTGKSPFKATHQSITKANINNKKLKFNQPPLSTISPQAKDLITLMLERNFQKRISAAQALNHPWISNSSQLQNPLKLQNLNQLFRYQKGNNLISVIESYISFKRTTQQERERLGQIFSAIDADGNGTIEISELVQIYNKNVDTNYTIEEITQIIKSIDKDKSGKIDFNQFIIVMEGRKNLFITEYLTDAFDYFDEDRTGYLDRQEITQILKGGDIVEIDNIIKKLDKDGDKKVSKEEFISYFANY